MTDPSQRPTRLAGEVEREAGVDDALIEKLVHAFYARVREDALIGPVFMARVADWDEHLGRMCRFWSSVLLASGTYQGQPMRKHQPLPIDAEHFDRWLELFRETTAAVCSPAAAKQFVSRAENIARSLELGIAVSRGVMLGKDERYRQDR